MNRTPPRAIASGNKLLVLQYNKRERFSKEQKDDKKWKEISYTGNVSDEDDLANFFSFQGHLEGSHWSHDLEKEIERRSEVGVIGHGGQLGGGITIEDPKGGFLPFADKQDPHGVLSDILENPEKLWINILWKQS